MPKAYRDLDELYTYIAIHIGAEDLADNLINEIEKAIFTLDFMPNRYGERLIGNYGGKGYRQFFIKNYVIVYRVVEEKKNVLIVTIRYKTGDF